LQNLQQGKRIDPEKMPYNFLLGLVLVLLPQRLRRNYFPGWDGNIQHAATVSGIAQSLAMLVLIILGFFYHMNSRLGMLSEALIAKDAATAMSGTGVQFGMGFTSLLEYLLKPTTLVMQYFALEGVVRIFGAMTTGEVVGTLPLFVVDWVIQKRKARIAEKKLGPIIPDEVRSAPIGEDNYELMVASCREKPDWNHLTTISYRDKLYEVADHFCGAAPRPYLYLLRTAPLDKVIRGLIHYDPLENFELTKSEPVAADTKQ
jgi:hypothetical protein